MSQRRAQRAGPPKEVPPVAEPLGGRRAACGRCDTYVDGDLGWNQTRRAAGPAGRQNDIQIDAELNSESNGAIARSQLVLEVEILQFLYFRFLDFAKFYGHYINL